VLFSHRVICNSEDYVKASRFLRHFRGRIEVCYPPCARLEAGDAKAPIELSEGQRLIGFAGRFAEEKGVGYILEAIPRVLESYPDAVFAFAGEAYAVGEQVYEHLRRQIEALGDRVRLLGVLPEAELAAFYARCDLLLLPSINSTESFGMVQIEAMYEGVPVIAADIPGVRVPVSVTAMGKLVPPRDKEALADAIVEALGNRESYVRSQADLEALFGVERAVSYYEQLFGARVGVSPNDASVATSP
jgi:glycosyltransferase involved in cell wall biosynthesis